MTLLREALDVLRGELSVLSEHRPEDLPELKKKKVVLASRLGALCTPPAEQDISDLASLAELVTELEAQSRQEIRSHLALLGNRLYLLQEEHQYWRECLNVSFGKFCQLTP